MKQNLNFNIALYLNNYESPTIIVDMQKRYSHVFPYP